MTTDFSGFGLSPKLMQSLVRMQFTVPTPIQAMAIPLALAGRDILGSAQTGTGKTGAFGIPLINKLIDNPEATAVVLTPTRELATQVMAALQQMIPVPNIRTALLIGGEPMPRQFRQLHAHPRLIVGTPGRINDHLMRGSLRLNSARFLVLDETDRMLDMGFGVQIERIVDKMPKERQTMMFSATLPPEIVKMSNKYLVNPERISAGSTTEAAPNIQQELVQVSDADKYPRLLEHLNGSTCTVIVFVKTKYGTEKLADKLCKLNLAADAVHGDLKQSRRDRVIRDFREKKFRILVATDLASRGLDIPHIELVINYDMPQCPEDYIHRIGRTARAGASGKAVNLLASGDRDKWRAICRLMKLPFQDDGHSQQGHRGNGQDQHRRNRNNNNRRRFSGPRNNRTNEHRGNSGHPGNDRGAPRAA